MTLPLGLPAGHDHYWYGLQPSDYVSYQTPSGDWLKALPGQSPDVLKFVVGGGLVWGLLGSLLGRWRRPNAVGPFGTPAAPFVILRRPDGTRVIDDLVPTENVLQLLDANKVTELRVREVTPEQAQAELQAERVGAAAAGQEAGRGA